MRSQRHADTDISSLHTHCPSNFSRTTSGVVPWKTSHTALKEEIFQETKPGPTKKNAKSPRKILHVGPHLFALDPPGRGVRHKKKKTKKREKRNPEGPGTWLSRPCTPRNPCAPNAATPCTPPGPEIPCGPICPETPTASTSFTTVVFGGAGGGCGWCRHRLFRCISSV